MLIAIAADCTSPKGATVVSSTTAVTLRVWKYGWGLVHLDDGPSLSYKMEQMRLRKIGMHCSFSSVAVHADVRPFKIARYTNTGHKALMPSVILRFLL